MGEPEDKTIIHKYIVDSERPHILGSECWCEPTVEKVD